MDIKGKEGSFMPIFFVMLASILIAFFWNSFTFIKNTAHGVLDPSAGALLNWNLTYGFLFLIFILTLITTIAQKYLTDQQTIREMKAEQKKINDEIKEIKGDTSKIMELQKKQMEFIAPMMKLTMRPMVFTGIPFILLFRWFLDFFGSLTECGFYCGSFGWPNWLWAYLIMSLVFGSILRKVLKVV
jgi:uncharacterized membrane protein (DUF106 family)